MKFSAAELYSNCPVQSHLPEMARNTMIAIEKIFQLIRGGMLDYNQLHE